MGIVLLRATGPGTVWISPFGAMKELAVDGEYFVDDGHVVAFAAGMTYRIEKCAA